MAVPADEIPKVVVYKWEKLKKIKQSGGAETDNLYCSDYFLKGKATVIKLITILRWLKLSKTTASGSQI